MAVSGCQSSKLAYTGSGSAKSPDPAVVRVIELEPGESVTTSTARRPDPIGGATSN